jgi:hypothetical protein
MVAHLTIQSRGDVRFDLVAQLFFKNFSFFSCISEKIFSYLYYQNEIIIKSNTMKNFENIADIITIKEHMDYALSNSYEGILFSQTFDALGHELTIYTTQGTNETEAILMSDKLDTIYVLNNSTGSQARIIEELTK